MKSSQHSSFFSRFFHFILIAFAFFYTSASYALDVPSDDANLADMLVKLSTSVPEFMRLATAAAYVIGFFFVFKGILALKQYAESRTMMSSQHDLKGPLIYLTVGALLIYLPTTVQAGLTTFWSDPTPYAYVDSTSIDPWSDLINAFYMIIQLVGTISFIRGLIILSSMGGQAQQGTFGKGLTHVVGGILCINIYQFLEVVHNTFL